MATPVRNEAGQFAAGLDSLARQDFDGVFDLLLLNNCTDAAAEIIAGFPASRIATRPAAMSYTPHSANAASALAGSSSIR